MKNPIDRREFVKRCVAVGAGMIAGPSLSEALERGIVGVSGVPATYELSAVTGDRYFENTLKAVDAIGGMGRFVKRGQTVGILINSPLPRKATYTNPDIALAVVRMCLDAGAKQIISLNSTEESYWRRGSLFDKFRTEVGAIVVTDETTGVTIERGRALKYAEVSRPLLTCDVFINIPIIKDHEGTRYTCTMKNMMGACTSSTCRRFHFGESSGVLNLFKGYYSDPELLSQSIADINLVRRPALSVVDATEILATNGPSGPGEVRKPREVIASTDGLAADMYATRHLGLDWQELQVIRFGIDHGYGPKSLQEVKIQTL